MGFKALTKKGENFIKTIASGSGNSLLVGNISGRQLPFSNVPVGTIFTATPKNQFGLDITTNEQLAEALIFWFNKYSEEYLLDANIIAAQAYQESRYEIFAYAKSPSSAAGISQFLSSTLFEVAIGNVGYARNTRPLFTDSEIQRLTAGLNQPNDISSYLYTLNNNIKNTSSDIERAINNRPILFQRIIDNPDLMIKAQCRLMKAMADKTEALAASCLFGYNRGPGYARKTYTASVKAQQAKNKEAVEEGVKYVNRIFRILGGREGGSLQGISFGYENLIDYSFDKFTADAVSSNLSFDFNPNQKISDNFLLKDLLVTNTGIINTPSANEVRNLEDLAENVLEPIVTIIGGRENVNVNSAFRSEFVNASVGGVANSQHRLGQGADLRILNRPIFDTFVEIVNSETVPYDQIIYELNENTGAEWIHVSYNSSGNNRRQALTASFPNGKAAYTPYTA